MINRIIMYAMLQNSVYRVKLKSQIMRKYRNRVIKVKTECHQFRLNDVSSRHLDGPRAVMALLEVPVDPNGRGDIPGVSSNGYSTFCA